MARKKSTESEAEAPAPAAEVAAVGEKPQKGQARKKAAKAGAEQALQPTRALDLSKPSLAAGRRKPAC